MEYAALLPSGNTKINDSELTEGDFAVFSKEGSEISFVNNSNTTSDIMVFGGEPYSEPIVAHGPFVMNTQTEIMQAFSDYKAGKYGDVDHSKVQLLQNENVHV